MIKIKIDGQEIEFESYHEFAEFYAQFQAQTKHPLMPKGQDVVRHKTASKPVVVKLIRKQSAKKKAIINEYLELVRNHGRIPMGERSRIATKYGIKPKSVSNILYNLLRRGKLPTELEVAKPQPVYHIKHIREAIVEHYMKMLKRGRIKRHAKKVLAKKLGITMKQITSIFQSMRKSNVLPKELHDHSFHKSTKDVQDKVSESRDSKVVDAEEYMRKRKPYVPTDYTESAIKKAQVSVKAEDLEFPNIYPLTEESCRTFEQMLISMIANKGKISYFEARNNLMLVNGKEWDGRVWVEFCMQVLANTAKICTALNCNKNKINVRLIDGYHYICHG